VNDATLPGGGPVIGGDTLAMIGLPSFKTQAPELLLYTKLAGAAHGGRTTVTVPVELIDTTAPASTTASKAKASSSDPASYLVCAGASDRWPPAVHRRRWPSSHEHQSANGRDMAQLRRVAQTACRGRPVLRSRPRGPLGSLDCERPPDLSL
jgi:hypothetical protein